MQESLLNMLRQVDTATVCNVIELFEVRPRNRGFMTGEIKAVFPNLPPMVGFASTATCRTYVQPPNRAVPKAPDLIERFADLSGPAVIVMQNLDTMGLGGGLRRCTLQLIQGIWRCRIGHEWTGQGLRAI